MKRDDDGAFRDYVAVRLEQLRRTAYLYCRDWHLADDLVGVTVGKLYVHWRRAQTADNVDAYFEGRENEGDPPDQTFLPTPQLTLAQLITLAENPALSA